MSKKQYNSDERFNEMEREFANNPKALAQIKKARHTSFMLKMATESTQPVLREVFWRLLEKENPEGMRRLENALLNPRPARKKK